MTLITAHKRLWTLIGAAHKGEQVSLAVPLQLTGKHVKFIFSVQALLDPMLCMQCIHEEVNNLGAAIF